MIRVHKDLILGRAEVVAIKGVRCKARIFSGGTVGVCHSLFVRDVRLEVIGIGVEGRLVLRKGKGRNGVLYLLLPD
jgi:hypothetical protein